MAREERAAKNREMQPEKELQVKVLRLLQFFRGCTTGLVCLYEAGTELLQFVNIVLVLDYFELADLSGEMFSKCLSNCHLQQLGWGVGPGLESGFEWVKNL